MIYIGETFPPLRLRSGASAAAQAVDRSTADALYQSRLSPAKPNKLLNDLWSLAAQHYLSTTPVGYATLVQAVIFLMTMPSDLPLPEISVDPDGEIALDWCRGEDMLSLSLGASGRLSYAWNIEDEARHGTEVFDGVLAPSILGAIKQFV